MIRLLVYLNFYKTFIVWSIIINVLLASVDSDYTPALLTKNFLTIFAWYFMTETANKRQFTFYKNLSITPIKLFAFVLFLDCLMTIAFLFLTKTLL